MSGGAEIYDLIVLGLVSAALVFFGIAWGASKASAIGLLDKPDDRKRHHYSVPAIGGLAIYLVLAAFTLTFPVAEVFRWLVGTAFILVLIGAWDDARQLSVGIKLVGQVFATILMIWGSGIWVTHLGIEAMEFEFLTGWSGILATVVGVVGLTNAYNMTDGLDGLAAGHVLLSVGTVCSTMVIAGANLTDVKWFSVLAATIIAFALVNLSLTPLRRVFLGDAGSLFLGFTVAWILIIYSQLHNQYLPSLAALWCVSMPLADMLCVVIRRVRTLRSPFQPDRSHLHHYLVTTGLSAKQSVAIILITSTCVNAFGIWVTIATSALTSLLAFLAFLVVYWSSIGIIESRACVK